MSMKGKNCSCIRYVTEKKKHVDGVVVSLEGIIVPELVVVLEEKMYHSWWCHWK